VLFEERVEGVRAEEAGKRGAARVGPQRQMQAYCACEVAAVAPWRWQQWRQSVCVLRQACMCMGVLCVLRSCLCVCVCLWLQVWV